MKLFADTDDRLKRFALPLLVALTVAALTAFAPTLYAEGTSLPKWPHEIGDLSADPSVTFGRMPNGFRYMLKENHEPKDRVSMHLVIRTGALMEADDQQGVAHFLEHMQFNGSTHFKPGELVKYFQSIGMQFGPDANAHTGFDETVFDVVLSKGDSESIAGGFRVLKDYAEGAALSADEIDRERSVILAEKRSRDSADYRTFVSTLRFELPEARISKRLPIGEDSVLKAVGRNRIKSFYDVWYRPERMVLVVAGDFDTKAVVSQIEEVFSVMVARAPAIPEPDSGRIHHEGDKSFYHYEPEAGNTSVSIEGVWKVEKTADSLSFRKQLLLNEIADSMVRNRLAELSQKPETPFTSADIHSGRYLEDIEFVEMTAESDPAKWQASLSTLERILRGAIDHGFTRSELDRVRKDYAANLKNAVKQASTRKSRDLAQGMITAINTDRVFMSPEQEERLLAPFIETLDIETVNAAFRKNWGHGHRLFLVTGNAKIGADTGSPESAILSVINESRKTAVAKPVDVSEVRFPYLPEPLEKGKVLERIDVSDLGIAQISFDNHVRLNLKKTDFEAGKIRITVSFGRGKSDEPAEKPGLSLLAEAVVNESGLGALTKDELERALAGKESRLSFKIEEDYFCFTGDAPSHELALVFQLLHARFKDPGFRPEAYKLTTDRLAQMYQSLSRDIEGGMQLAGQRFLSGSDGRFGLPPYERFRSLTLLDVKDWILPSLDGGPIEISLVGDFDEKQAIELTASYLSRLGNRTGLGPVGRNDVPRFPSGKELVVDVDTQIPKGLVVVAYPTDDFWDIGRTRRLSVLGDIFTERLRETVREKLGISYSPFAHNRPSRAYPGYGLFQAFVYIDPDIASRAIDEVKKIGLEISQSGVSADDLSRSIQPILTGIKEMRNTNAYWLRSVLVGSVRHPQQIDWSRSMLADFASITTEDISALAGQYFVVAKSAHVVIRPVKTP